MHFSRVLVLGRSLLKQDKYAMKKLITSASLAVLAAAAVNAQQTLYAPAPALTSTDLAKPWSIAASLRGFYDDNYTLSPKALKRDSYGYELSPSFGLNWTME